MIITDIKPDKKHLTRVYSGENYLLIDSDITAELCVGMDINAEEIKYSSDLKRAKSRALWLLERMDYTEKKLYEKLITAGFSKKASAEVLSKLCELGLVDDRRYAERYAARLMDTNTSKREAVSKMLGRGIPLELAKEVLAECDTDEETQIRNLLEGKYAYKLTRENGSEKVYAALVRKGFSYSAVRSAFKKYIEETEFEDY